MFEKKAVLAGIRCEAKECKYHTKSDECCAPCIAVSGEQAHCAPDTACATFEEE